MKILVRVLAALAVVALAHPAFACDGEKKQTTMAAKEKKAQEKKAAEKAAAQAAQTAQAPAKPAAAQN